MYKVYINSLLKELSDFCFAISVNTVRIPIPSFVDDICLIALRQSLLIILMHKCQTSSKTWRYEFNHSKSGVVILGETKPINCKPMKEREWALGYFYKLFPLTSSLLLKLERGQTWSLKQLFMYQI